MFSCALQDLLIYYPGSPQQYVWIFNVPSFNDTGEVNSMFDILLTELNDVDMPLILHIT